MSNTCVLTCVCFKRELVCLLFCVLVVQRACSFVCFPCAKCPVFHYSIAVAGSLTQSTWQRDEMHPRTWTEEDIRAAGFWAARQGPGCDDGALATQTAAAFAAVGADAAWREEVGQHAARQAAARRRARALLQEAGDVFESVDHLVAGAVGVLAEAGDRPAQEDVAAAVAGMEGGGEKDEEAKKDGEAKNEEGPKKEEGAKKKQGKTPKKGNTPRKSQGTSKQAQGGDPSVATTMTEKELQAWYYEEGASEQAQVDFDSGDLGPLYEEEPVPKDGGEAARDGGEAAKVCC